MLLNIDGHLYNFTGILFENFFSIAKMIVRVSHSIKEIKAIKNSVVVTIKEHPASSETSRMIPEISRIDFHTFIGISFFFFCNLVIILA